jgi:hypothetical protein
MPATDCRDIISNGINNTGREHKNSTDMPLPNRIKGPFKRPLAAKDNIAFRKSG